MFFRNRILNTNKLVNPNVIRSIFSTKLSEMYRQEVPQYDQLLQLVRGINEKKLLQHSELRKQSDVARELIRITKERHGAIRLGKPEELKWVCDLFEVMGMYPVGYYDLSVSGMPIHSTAIRSLTLEELEVEPIRFFVSLLRPELIQDKEAVDIIQKHLSNREIFSERLKELIKLNKQQNGLTEKQAEEFVYESIEVFRWHHHANISFEDYQKLTKIHPLAADIVSFKGPHINHLTPRTLDIDLVQAEMIKHNMNPKAVIEGPPLREVPIELRQTAIKSLNELAIFRDQSAREIKGTHTARFGEVEQRGAALKPKGMDLYLKLTDKVRKQIEPKQDGSNAVEYYRILAKEFESFPDNLEELRKLDMVYLHYYPTDKGIASAGNFDECDIDTLVTKGYVAYSPIVYEDFLPVSAAGIFTSNLGGNQSQLVLNGPDQEGFEKTLGKKVIDPFKWYEKHEKESIKQTLALLYPVKKVEHSIGSLKF